MSAKSEVYFSVDIEADGPYPGDYSMSSFGIVACGRRDLGGFFYRLDVGASAVCHYNELKPISDMFDPEAAAVSGLDRDQLKQFGSDPGGAMRAAAAWIDGATKRIDSTARPVFVGYPLCFDWLFFYWYLMKYNRSSPFGHSSALDIKTLYATKAGVPMRQVGKRSIPKELHSKRRHTHNALDDAREQGELFQNITEWNPTKESK